MTTALPLRHARLLLSLTLSGVAGPGAALPAAAASTALGEDPARRGTVRVIVEVIPAGYGGGAAAIGEAQDAVIAALPSGDVVVLIRYRNLPLLALELDPALIPAVQQIPYVASVVPDEERTLD